MRRVRNVAFAVVGTLLALVAYQLIVLTRTDQVLWFTIDQRAALTADGKPVDGWLLRERRNWAVIVTYDRLRKRVSYFVTFLSDPTRAFVQRCRRVDGAPTSCFPFPSFASDTFECTGWTGVPHPEESAHMNPKATLGPKEFEFAAEDGSVIRARWKSAFPWLPEWKPKLN